MSESKKQQIFRDIYFDKAGYGSRNKKDHIRRC